MLHFYYNCALNANDVFLCCGGMLQSNHTIPDGTLIDIDALLPAGSKAHIQYPGSLTTPPCSTGLLWHVFTKVGWVARVPKTPKTVAHV